MTLLKGREIVYNGFESGVFPLSNQSIVLAEPEKSSLINYFECNLPELLTPKGMFQRLPIALAQVEADNTSENVLNEISQIIYSLYRAKEITKKVYRNTMNSIEL